MIRKRRKIREVPFSLDCFLDVLANVIGIIIRMILVVWVGARSYTALQHLPTFLKQNSAPVAEVPITDPLQQELARQQQELAAAKKRLLEQLQHVPNLTEATNAQQQLAVAISQREHLQQKVGSLDALSAVEQQLAQQLSVSVEDLRKRQEQVRTELAMLEKLPPPTKKLEYRTPVSHPVFSDELFFECRASRVTFIDVAAFLSEIRDSFEGKAERLKDQWQLDELTKPIGSFRVRYVVEREKNAVDQAIPGSQPSSNGFRYSLREWHLEPLSLTRGETAEIALQPYSGFRQIVDRVAPKQSVITFWVYPDSFALYRQLRDYLYQRDIEVAARPIPEGASMGGSRRGSVSRGQ